MLYGLLELALAVVTGGAAISKVREGDLSVWLALAASMYLVVRSLDNMHQSGFKLIDTCNDYVGTRIFRRQKTLDVAAPTAESQ
jgi:hypothetical protein